MHTLTQRLSYIVGTVFGVGYAPKAPGTFGTIPGVFIYLLCPDFAWIVFLFFLGWLSTIVIIKDCDNKDPSFVVIDEVVGMMLCLWLVSFAGVSLTPPYLLAGFLAFRFFDIIKPWPIKKIEALCKEKGYVTAALGVMIDDVLAGVMGVVILIVSAKLFTF